MGGGRRRGARVTAQPRATLEFLHGGSVARLTLRAPKANILDAAMIAALDEGVRDIIARGSLNAVIITSAGPHFSFGASVEEHLPDRIRLTLAALHALLRRLLDVPAPTIGALRGQCLGGGLELALACDLLIAEETAQLGCPEIKLGVFPPAASALLPARVGAARAAALTLTGASISGKDAAAMGLVTRVAPDGGLEASLEAWLAEAFLTRSPAGLRFAAEASRAEVRRAAAEILPAAESLYLNDLMRESDAVEGIRAFLEKREPRWIGRHA
jgi:cyclohexa-1,5-dienecarbonyl-CoA hydratase